MSEPVTTPEISEVEQAAQKFTQLLPFVTKLANAMNQGGVVRVMTAMAEFPLAGRKPRLLNEAERQLFHLLQELNQSKSVVISDIMKKNFEAEELRKKSLAMTQENSTAENSAGVSNEQSNQG